MKITAKLIRSFDPCYDPSEVEEDESLEITPLEFIEQFEGRVRDKEDILWVFLRNEFMSDKDLRLFAVWCAREALKQVPNPDPVGVEAVNVAERYANGEASGAELEEARSAAYSAAYSAAWSAAESAAWSAAWSAAESAAESAAWSAAWSAARSAARSAAWSAARDAIDAQIEHLKTYFKK